MIQSIGGSVTQVGVYITQPISPEQCVDMGRECVINLLCKATECIVQHNYILIKWIW